MYLLFPLTFKRSDKENERNVEERDQGGQGDVAEGRATYSHTSKLIILIVTHFLLTCTAL